MYLGTFIKSEPFRAFLKYGRTKFTNYKPLPKQMTVSMDRHRRRKIMRQHVCEIRVLFILNIRDVSIYISCSTAKSAPVASMLIL